MDPDEMRRRANRYRHIARTITDARAIEALNDLAGKYEAEADKVQARTRCDADDEQTC